MTKREKDLCSFHELESIGSIIARIYGDREPQRTVGRAMLSAAEDQLKPQTNVVELHSYSKKVQ